MKFCEKHYRAYPDEHSGCSFCYEEKKPAKVSRAKPKQEIKKQSAKNAQLKRQVSKTRKEVMAKGYCTGCGKTEGNGIILEDSHLISRQYCEKYNRMDLYTAIENRTPHCKTWMDHKGCHSKWESNAERHTLLDYRPNMAFIKAEIPQLAKVMLMNEAEAKMKATSKLKTLTA